MALERDGEWQFKHAADAETPVPTGEDARWAIETVARSVMSLEKEWPDFILVEKPEPQTSGE